MSIVKDDVCCYSGPLQVCAGQEGGCEGAVHAMRAILEDDARGCVLLVDARNAFNALNRRVALHNARILCPIIATALFNTYRVDILMYVIGGETIQSTEGTTQGDPLAMSMYVIGISPLITKVMGTCKQVWFADDATGAACIKNVSKWWDAITEHGPEFGYFAKMLTKHG